ncbi:MAG: hypothetical protein IKW64_01545 [Clostridia bacterium]|nr:hypothetical protein [Clostridia bacterium]
MNKLMARIVAVVMAIAMLGTVSFADVTGADYDNGTLTPGTPDVSRTTKTLLAFATDSANDFTFDEGNDVIIALVQDDTIDTTIPVDTTRVGNKKYISVIIGGDGTTDTAYIDNTPEVAAINASTEPITIDGIEYKNVVSVTYNITDGNGRTLAKYGMSFNSYDKTTGEVRNVDEKIDVVTVPTGAIVLDGTFTFTAVVLGVNVEALNGTVKATPIIEYAE